MPRSESPNDREDDSRSASPERRTSLLVRNLVILTQDYNIKQEELKEFYSKFGEIRDIYLPRDFYTQRPRGFGFIEFRRFADAKTAREETDDSEVLGCRVKVVFAHEGRKTVSTRQPYEMRKRDRDYRRRSPRRRRPSRR